MKYFKPGNKVTLLLQWLVNINNSEPLLAYGSIECNPQVVNEELF